MFLVVALEPDPDHRYHPRAIRDRLPAETEYVVLPESPTKSEPDLERFDGVVLSGSSAHIYEEAETEWLVRAEGIVERCLEAEIPLLGICFGHQLLNWTLGGRVERDRYRTGFVECDHADVGVLEGVGQLVPVAHSDVVTDVGDGLSVIGRTDYDEAFCTRHEAAPCWSVQFHPEFTADVAARIPDWSAGPYSFTDSTAERVLENFVAAYSSDESVRF